MRGAAGTAASIGEERKIITALFADIVGSTSLGEEHDVEEVGALLNAYFSAMSSTIESWGGRVEKFIGDAVLAYFGVPVVREDDAERAVRAGFDMLERLEQLNQRFLTRHMLTLAIRIGIATGEAVVPAGGPVEAVIGGDVVNVAARLQAAASEGEILVGRRTHDLTRALFQFEPLRLVLKGKKDPVEAYHVTLAATSPARRPLRLQAPMVGRDGEARTLLELLDETLQAKRVRTALIEGPPGIGKSRLAREFVIVAAARPEGPRVLSGACLPPGRGGTYWALSVAVRERAGIALSDAPNVAQRKLEDFVSSTLHDGAGANEGVRDIVDAMAMTAAIQIADNPLEKERPSALSYALARAWTTFLTAYAQPSGAVLAIEDMHWAAEPLLTLLRRVARRAGAPLLILATTRTHTDTAGDPDSGLPGQRVLSLEPLDAAASHQLTRSLLLGRSLHQQAEDLVVDRTEGNPLFLEELLEHVIEHTSGQPEQGAGADKRSDVKLPDSISAVLAARIDSLPALEKRVLQEGAVLGRTFWQAPLSQRTQHDIATTLLRLEDRGFVQAAPISSMSGELEFSFKHALVRDVAYNSLPRAERARAHAAAAQWLEARAGERVGEVLELVAFHYHAAIAEEGARLAWIDEPDTAAQLLQRAITRLQEAGVAARRRRDVVRALELHGQALALARSPAEQAALYEAIGDDHEIALHGDGAIENWQSALAILRQDPTENEHRALICLNAAVMIVVRWGGFQVPGDPALADQFIDEGLAAAQEASTRAQLLSLRAICAGRQAWLGAVDPISLAARRQAADEAEQLWDRSDPELEFFLLSARISLAYAAGDYAAALQGQEHVLDAANRMASARDIAYAHVVVALGVANLRHRFDEALWHAEQCYERSRELSPHDVMHATCQMMDYLYHLGRWDEVQPVLERHLDQYHGHERHMSCPYIRSGPLLGALVLAHRGQTAEAREVAALVEPDLLYPGMAEAVRAELLLVLGEPDAAIEILEPLIKRGRRPSDDEIPIEPRTMVDVLLARHDWKRLDEYLPTARAAVAYVAALEATCDRAEGSMLAARGDVSGGIRLLDTALQAFESLLMPFEAARTMEELAAFSPDRANGLLEQARDTYVTLRAVPHVARIEAALALGGAQESARE